MSSKQDQVAAQCRVVAALCGRLANVSSDYAMLVAKAQVDDLLDMIGYRTARQMEMLGDELNGMDAVAPEDYWMAPVFHEARRLWSDTMEPIQ